MQRRTVITHGARGGGGDRSLHGATPSLLFFVLFAQRIVVRQTAQVELILRELEQGQGEPQLHAKALRQGGDILWKLHREEEGVASYLRCLSVVSEAEKVQDASHEGR